MSIFVLKMTAALRHRDRSVTQASPHHNVINGAFLRGSGCDFSSRPEHPVHQRHGTFLRIPGFFVENTENSSGKTLPLLDFRLKSC